MPIHEDEVVISLKVLQSQLSKIDEHLERSFPASRRARFRTTSMKR